LAGLDRYVLTHRSTSAKDSNPQDDRGAKENKEQYGHHGCVIPEHVVDQAADHSTIGQRVLVVPASSSARLDERHAISPINEQQNEQQPATAGSRVQD